MERGETSSIDQAMKARTALSMQVEADGSRPVYHYRPPAGWMNDPNGTIFWRGSYHLFYQHYPYDGTHRAMHWGHARSADLVCWEEQAIALSPSPEIQEEGCWSGCCAIGGNGEPTILYTSNPIDLDRSPRTQIAATGDKELIEWNKIIDGPVLSVESHGGPPIEGTWRDPFIFEAESRTFLLIGATIADGTSDSAVLLYESADDSLLRWQYRGELIRRPSSEVRFFECPTFAKIDEKWILMVSPFAPVHYYTGAFDAQTGIFAVENEGVVDPSSDFYATNVFVRDQQPTVMVGWIRGFPEGRLWNGCLSLPRVLSVGSDGQLTQQPIDELRTLRTEHRVLHQRTITSDPVSIGDLDASSIEVKMSVRLPARASLRLQSREGVGVQRLVECDPTRLQVGGIEVDIKQRSEPHTITLHLFRDRSVLEVFAEGGQIAVSRVIDCIDAPARLEIVASHGEVRVDHLDAWELRRPLSATALHN